MSRFWPGFNWRILAHRRGAPNSRGAYFNEQHAVYAGPRWADHSPRLDGHWEFDELVIDHWFHLEQMSDRQWWILIGDMHVWVTINADKSVRVTTTRDEKAA